MAEQKKMKIRQGRYSGYVIMAFFLLLCLSLVSVTASKYISDLTISSCFRKLKDSAGQYALNIRRDVETDSAFLQATAGYMAERDGIDPEEIREILGLSKAGVMLDGMGLILPDGHVYAGDESYLENLKAVSYENEAAKGVHISERVTDLNDSEKFYLYHFVPVIKDGRAEGLLCGIIDLEKLGKQYMDSRRMDGTAVHLIEGKSSAFLVDTVHPKFENAEDMRSRDIKKGYSIEKVLDDIINGKPGETAFFSTSNQEYFYCAYVPVGINDWMVMLGQPESIAFRDAKNVRTALRNFALLESAAFLIYLAIAFFGARRAARDKEKELDRVQYILKVEEILFNAARKPNRIEEALKETANKLYAEYAFFIIYDDDGNEKMYTWREQERDEQKGYLKSDFPVLCSRFLPQGSILSYDMQNLIGDTEAEYLRLKQLGIESLMVIPVNEPDQTHVGSLGAANMHRRFHTTELLECVMLVFSMAVKNIASFQKIEKMGTRDSLTGLKNRNSYQHALEAFEKDPDSTLFCVYMDADGLHGINNFYGHEAGDLLLKTVAGVLMDEFGLENAYRIGGDEFVAFGRGLDREQMEEKICRTEEKIEKNGYHISVGSEQREDEPFVYEMIRNAEAKMFEAKRRYHETKGDVQRTREMDQKLEETLMEKKNLDVFRSVLSSKYLGVYIVSLGTDTFRYIYIPSYFNDAAKQSGGRFSEAVRLYIAAYVKEEYQEDFLRLLDYKSVGECLNEGGEPRLLYARPDGLKILLKIYRSPDYDDTCRECIWTFEKADHNKK